MAKLPKKNIKKIGTVLIIILLTIWFIVALGRTFYNLSKLYTEEKSWYLLSTEQQKAKQFGELHYLYQFVDLHTQNDSVIKFYTHDNKAYYLGRYYLYPKKVISKFNKNLWANNIYSYNYYLIYPIENKNLIKEIKNDKNYNKLKQIAQFKYKGKIKAILYKL